MSTSSKRPNLTNKPRATASEPATTVTLRLLAAGPQRRAMLIVASARPESAIAQALTTMRHRGVVQRVKHGYWTLTEAGHTAAAKLRV